MTTPTSNYKQKFYSTLEANFLNILASSGVKVEGAIAAVFINSLKVSLTAALDQTFKDLETDV